MFPWQADMYSVSSDAFACDEAKENSVYNLTFRYSPVQAWPEVASDSRIVVYGVNDFVQNYMTVESDKATREQMVDEFARFMESAHSFGGPLPFNRNLWDQWIHNGTLPLEIKSVPDGTVVFPNEPILECRNTKTSYGELACWLEARLLGMVSVGSAAASLCRHWYDKLCHEVKLDLACIGNTNPTQQEIDNVARWQIHNFGSRACSTDLEDKLIGKAHLLSFLGSDNGSANFECWKQGMKRPGASSIIAIAHRHAQSFSQETDCFKSAINATLGEKVRICSLVADCFNYNNAVESITDLALQNPDVIHVIRPDSLGFFETVKTIFKVCKRKNLLKEINGYYTPTNIRYIYGDSVKPAVQFETMNKLRELGYLPTLNGIVGVGGFIRNNCTRDSLSAAYKLTAVGKLNRPVVKLSETPTKLSIPGPTTFVDCSDERIHMNTCGLPDLKQVVYNNGVVEQNFNFQECVDRSMKQWYRWSDRARNFPTWGLTRESLSGTIREIQDQTFAKYRT
jgi:nicotinic acid phosphoribosyltransferase